MQINSINRPPAALADPGQTAVSAIREQFERLERNVTEVARGQDDDGFAPGSRNRALVEQIEIVQAVRANAKSLEASNQAVGTIIDMKV